jgi:thiol-disulfide isomerase/thioredoxin
MFVRVTLQNGELTATVYRQAVRYLPRLFSVPVFFTKLTLDKRNTSARVVDNDVEFDFPEGTKRLFDGRAAEYGLEQVHVQQAYAAVTRAITHRAMTPARFAAGAFAGIGMIFVALLINGALHSGKSVAAVPTSPSLGRADAAAAAVAAGPAQSANTASVEESLQYKQEMSSAIVASEVASKNPPIELEDAFDKSSKISLRAPAKADARLVVWSDPFCPHCRDFEPVLEQLPASIAITVVPVAFQSGSRPFVSYISCGKDDLDRQNRWLKFMQPIPTGDVNLNCDDGARVADLNSINFARSGLTETPTIAALNKAGKLILYHGDIKNADAIATWAKGV